MAITATTTVAIIFRRFSAGRGSYSFASISAMRKFLLQRAFKKQCRKRKCAQGEPTKIQQVRPDCSQSYAFEEDRLETTNRISERINPGDPLQPFGKSLHRINCATGKIQQRI